MVPGSGFREGLPSMRSLICGYLPGATPGVIFDSSRSVWVHRGTLGTFSTSPSKSAGSVSSYGTSRELRWLTRGRFTAPLPRPQCSKVPSFALKSRGGFRTSVFLGASRSGGASRKVPCSMVPRSLLKGRPDLHDRSKSTLRAAQMRQSSRDCHPKLTLGPVFVNTAVRGLRHEPPRGGRP